MKRGLLVILLLLVGCEPRSSHEREAQGLTASDGVYSTIEIGGLKIALLNRKGHCALVYRSTEDASAKEGPELDVGMLAPCNFVGVRPEAHSAQHYFFGEGKNRMAALLITGGRPHASVSDPLQPNGCGTDLAKIRVYNDRVELAWSKPNGDTPSCPTQPQDEVMFAS